MAVDTKPNLTSNKFEQCVGDILTLSGCTEVHGEFEIQPTGIIDSYTGYQISGVTFFDAGSNASMIQIGQGALVNADCGIAIGHQSCATSPGGIAIGNSVSVTGTSTVNIGGITRGTTVTAVGRSSFACTASVVVGNGSTVSGNYSVGVGNTVNVLSTYSVGLGYFAGISALATSSVAIGQAACTVCGYSVAIGSAACTTQVCSIAVGCNACSTQSNSVALGTGAKAMGLNTIVLGCLACANNTCGLVIGAGSYATGTDSIMIGATSMNLGNTSIAIGNNVCQCSANNSIAIGSYAKTCGGLNVSIGNGSSAFCYDSIAIGEGNCSLCDFSITMGRLNKAVACETVAIGHLNEARGKCSYVLGGCQNIICSGNTRTTLVGGHVITLTGTSFSDYVVVPNIAIYCTPTTGACTDSVLVWNTTDKKVKKVPYISGGTITANNGLTKAGNIISLGGTLTGETQILMACKTFAITTSTFGPVFAMDDGSRYFYGCVGMSYQPEVNHVADMAVSSGSTIMCVRDTTGCKGIIFNDDSHVNTGMWVFDTTLCGLQYCGDYSANNVSNPRWIPDKAYVDGKVSGGEITGATNGLTVNSAKQVRLGGTLTGDTLIDTNGGNLSITGGTITNIKTSNINLIATVNNSFLRFNYGGGGGTTGLINCNMGLNLGHQLGAEYAILNIVGNNTTFTDTCTTTPGIQYGNNYSANYTNRSLVDKEYVDNLVTGGTSTTSGENITKLINQASHGFNVGDVLGWSLGSYTLPTADGTYDGEVLGIVSKCYNADCFDLTQAGYVTGLTGLVADTTYFLSPTTAGLLTDIEPSGNTQISKAVLIATASNSAWVLPYPGYIITTGSSGGGTITGAINLGSGNGTIFTSVSGTDIQLKTLSGGTNITLTCNGNYIGINSTASGNLVWTGNTTYGIGTYVDSTHICSQPNLTFDDTTRILTVLPGNTSPGCGVARLGMVNFCYSNDETCYLYTGAIQLGGVSNFASQIGSNGVGVALKHYKSGISQYQYAHIVVADSGFLASKVNFDVTDSTAAASGTWRIHPYVSNNTDNYLLTATGSGDINGEANLTFNGTCLNVNGCLHVTALPARTTETNILYIDSTGMISTGITTGGGTITGATNGLTVAGADIRLGGTLTGTTTITDSRGTPVGIEYGADYSLTFTDRSLVDKGYVDSKTSGTTLNAFTITGDGTSTGFTVNHNFNQTYVGVEIIKNTSPYPTIYTNTTRPTANDVCVTFDTAPDLGQEYKVLIFTSGNTGSNGASMPLIAEINQVSGTTYTIQSTDAGKNIEFTSLSATTITLPTGLTVGFQAVLVNIGGGNKTMVAGSGATLYTLNSNTIIAGAYNAATVYYREINKWVGFGNLS